MGWKRFALYILKNRIPILVLTFILTILIATQIRFELIYDILQIIPESDQEMIEFRAFKKEFGEDGNTIIIGLEGDVFSKDILNGIYDLSDSLKQITGIASVASISKAVYLVADDDSSRFRLMNLMPQKLSSDAAADSLKQLYLSLPFYKGLLVNEENNATLIAANIDSLTLYSDAKIGVSEKILVLAEKFKEKHSVKIHFSGLPMIRSFYLKTLPKEMAFFFVLAVFLTAISLLFFFRSWWLW